MRWGAPILLTGLLCTAFPAHADEQLFGYVATSETIPGGRTELYFEATDRRGKNRGRYNAQDYRAGAEHGISDYLQAAAYVALRSHNIRSTAPALRDRDSGIRLQGVDLALKQVLLSPYQDPIGLALAFEPAYARVSRTSGSRIEQYEAVLRAILQKTFLEDQLVLASNIIIGPRWQRPRGIDTFDTDWRLDFATGLSYRIAPKWFVAVEGQYRSFGNAPFDRKSFAVFAGPTLHYATQRWWATVSFQPQITGDRQGSHGDRNLVDYEKRELRLKIGVNF